MKVVEVTAEAPIVAPACYTSPTPAVVVATVQVYGEHEAAGYMRM
jgi:hypothetical protein